MLSRSSQKRDPRTQIDPDEIFLDSANLSKLDVHAFEGRIERPIGMRATRVVGLFFVITLVIFAGRAIYLTVYRGSEYQARSERNHLRYTPVFSERGAIVDRNGVELAVNMAASGTEFSLRHYTTLPGFSHLTGFVKYPSKDASGFYYSNETAGIDGVEKAYDGELRGKNGIRIIEVDAVGAVASKRVVVAPQQGTNVSLSIDSRLQQKLFELIKGTAERVGFSAGAGALMDIRTGELLALTSFPDYSSQVMTDGEDTKTINSYNRDPHKPFLNRAVDGLYTPGSIIKPFIATAALNEHIVTPDTIIVSTGSISIPNPFDSKKKTVFNDWKAHGPVDMRKALAVSSNVYFFEIGGGFGSQPGLGIGKIELYLKRFGFGSEIDDPFLHGQPGTIPTPSWKLEHFNGEPWRIGDTYNTSIGQYGVQITPLQAVRAIAGLANGTYLPRPTIVKTESPLLASRFPTFAIDEEIFRVVWEGMRQGVLSGTARGLSLPGLSIAAKTGTAELGTAKDFVNSWVVGFYPYENPHYAFAVLMEKGPRDNLIGATFVTRGFLEWLLQNAPEYTK